MYQNKKITKILKIDTQEDKNYKRKTIETINGKLAKYICELNSHIDQNAEGFQYLETCSTNGIRTITTVQFKNDNNRYIISFLPNGSVKEADFYNGRTYQYIYRFDCYRNARDAVQIYTDSFGTRFSLRKDYINNKYIYCIDYHNNQFISKIEYFLLKSHAEIVVSENKQFKHVNGLIIY